TQKSLIQVLPNQTVLGAQARPGPLPMFGNLADRIAYRAALAKLPESNLVAGQKVIDRLQPELDGKIDAELSQTNQLLREHLWKRLKDWNVSPDYKVAFSTSDRLCWDYRLNSQPISWTPGPA